MTVIDNKFEIGQIVYLKTDPGRNKFVVTGICIKPDNLLIYELSIGIQRTFHYEMEICTEQEILISE